MKIVPKRTMQLDGRQVVAGKVETVSQKEGELAIRHGWAVLYAKDAAEAAEAKAKKEAEEKAKAEKEAAAAEAKAKEEAEAAEKAKQEAEAEAKAEWEGSEELQAQFPDVADYLASLGACQGPA